MLNILKYLLLEAEREATALQLQLPIHDTKSVMPPLSTCSLSLKALVVTLSLSGLFKTFLWLRSTFNSFNSRLNRFAKISETSRLSSIETSESSTTRSRLRPLASGRQQQKQSSVLPSIELSSKSGLITGTESITGVAAAAATAATVYMDNRRRKPKNCCGNCCGIKQQPQQPRQSYNSPLFEEFETDY
jgi:hypothetical protein